MEIEVVSLSSIVAFFIALHETNSTSAQFLSIVKFCKDLIFVRHMLYENQIRSKILLTKYLSDENYRIYGTLGDMPVDSCQLNLG